MNGFRTIKLTFEFTVPDGTNDEETGEAIFDLLCNQDYGPDDGLPYFSCDGWEPVRD
jgi:hypothetical protein